MMPVLLVSATLEEVSGYARLAEICSGERRVGFWAVDEALHLLITGVGAASCALAMGQFAGCGYRLIVGVGFVGSYSPELAVGEVVVVSEDAFADYGVWRGDRLISIESAGFYQYTLSDASPFWRATTCKCEQAAGYRQVRGVTVAQPTCGEEGWRRLLSLEGVEVESMEGAAFALSCRSLRIPALSLRVVSNFAAAVDAAWNIPLAQARLGEALAGVLAEN